VAAAIIVVFFVPVPHVSLFHSLVTPAKVTAPTRLPVVDLSATPAGWVAVADGDVQISVPPTWGVLYNSGCPTGSPPGEVLVNPVPEFCPGEIAGEGPKNLVWLTLLTGLGSDYKHRSVINGFSVYDDTPVTYFVPSLRLRVTLSGPLAQRVLHTLTRSPRTVALANGAAPSVPKSWHQVTFAGLRFSVPGWWHTYRWVDSGVCGGNGPTLSGNAVWLTKSTHPVECKQPPVLPLVRQPGNAVQVDVDLSPLLVIESFSKHCLDLNGLTACPATSPAYSILVLKVTVQGRSKPVYVSIGLAGSGMVARTILYSLRAA
jgi:hypothetical protein